MGTSTSSDVDRWLRGSVADEVLRQANVPVLIVPPRAVETVAVTSQGVGSQRQRAHTYGQWWSGADEHPRILIALDGSELARRVLDPALALADVLKAELLLLRVGEPVREAEEYLDAVARSISSERTVSTLVTTGDPATAIVEAARTRSAHLIAMATHGRSGIARQLLGSVATATLQHASVPVLLVRPTAADG